MHGGAQRARRIARAVDEGPMSVLLTLCSSTRLYNYPQHDKHAAVGALETEKSVLLEVG